MAECHPVGFQWVVEAKKRGARIIHVDPRYTRTSAFANRHIGIRGGTDVVLLGAIIKYMLDNELYFHDYVVSYTNASSIISPDYQDTEDLDGLFSGYDPETGKYVTDSWQYVRKPEGSSWNVEKDETLQHPNSVFQILKRHYSRYTPEMVEETCGISQEDFFYLANSIADNSKPDRTTCFAYALGFTQHTLGAQFIRTAAILQLLMGNVGRPGSGIMALRGHASIQGSTDIPTLFNSLPGYLPMPHVNLQSWKDYVNTFRKEDQKGFWQIGENYAVSLMKSYWGDAATAENEWGYNLMPRISGAHSTYETLMAMLEHEVEGYIVFGQNPAVAQSNGGMQRRGLAALKWLVVRDFQEIETASFWKDSPEIKNGELKTEEIGTEVFLMPAATHVEKAGTFTQTQRMLQWRFQAVTPPGEATSDLWFFYQLGKKIKERLADSTDPRDLPVQKITWDYTENEEGEPDSEEILKEINGYYLDGPKKGELLPTFVEMKNDGSTSGGCWIYTGVFRTASTMPPRRYRDLNKTRSPSSGAGSGLQTAASSITVLPHAQTENHGLSARSTSGGMLPRRHGLATTSQTSQSTRRRITVRLSTPSALPRSTVTIHSSCRRMVSAGSSPRRDYRMARCQRTMSRMSPQRTTCSTSSSNRRRVLPLSVQITCRAQNRASQAPRSSRSCSPPTA